ncbi:MAG: heavy metal translocating P-type ATPase [Motiliproteus sp.]
MVEQKGVASSICLSLQGVSCNGCVSKIRMLLQESDPEAEISVDLQRKIAKINSLLSTEHVIEQIEELGYQARLVMTSQQQFQVEGIKCNGCLSKVRKALAERDPQAQAEADFEAKTLSINSLLDSQQLIDLVSALGYGIELLPLSETDLTESDPSEKETSSVVPSVSEEPVESKPLASSLATEPEVSPSALESAAAGQRFHLSLEGMTCASCVKSIEDALKTVPGVTGVDVNFGSRSALVAGNLAVASLIQAVADAGYGASEVEDPEQAERQKEANEAAEYKRKIINTAIGLGLGIPLMVTSLVHDMSVSSPWERGLWGLVGLLTLAVLLTAGRHFYMGAWKAFQHHNANMDTLIATGTGAAWLYSMVVVLMPEILPETARGLYFEAAAMIIGLINLGQALELKARGRTSQAIKRLLDLRTKTARVLREGEFRELSIDQVQQDDLIQVRPGEQIPVDGVVTEGHSTLDESMLTGEPMPVKKSAGDELSAGTLNRTGALTFKATRVGKTTVLAQIIEMVRKAQNSKPPISRLADQIASFFVPVVLLIAVFTALIWYNFGPEPQIVYMLVTATTVLIIACPCALGLATPISTMIGVGKAAEHGILIRNGEALQKASRLTTVVVDKTGTLTAGQPEVTEVELFGALGEQHTLALLHTLESRSEHPLGEALVDYAKTYAVDLSLDQFEALSGLGLQATIEGQCVLIGNPRLMAQEAINIEQAKTLAQGWEEQARTVVYMAIDGQLSALFGIADPLKPDALAAIQRLQHDGVKVLMLTGDNQATAAAVALATGIDDFRAQLLPEDKLAEIRRLQAQGEIVGMAGDGINDAPALSQADVGFAIGSGTDVAIESADITLMRGSLHGIADAIELSRATLKNIKQNLWGAFAYNSLGIPIAAGVLFPLTGLLLNPVIAGVAMSLSSVTVVSNANRLRFFQASRSKTAETQVDNPDTRTTEVLS